MIRPRIIFYVAFYLTLAAVAVRGLLTYFLAGSPLLWLVAGLLLIYLSLMISEPWLTRRFRWYRHLYLSLQAGLVLNLLLLPPYLDFFAILYIPLSVQAMLFFSQRTGFWWIGLFTLIAAGALIYDYGWLGGLPFVLLYGAGNFFVGSYASVTAHAEAARQESQALLSELQTAHRQLQAYAAQVEELVVTQERNRLARELHDSVTQTIFSITLAAKSGRILLERDPPRVAAQLDHLQKLAQVALAEMRALIFQLRPATVEGEGLISTLRKHIAALKSQEGLTVELRVEGQRRLRPEVESELFRIVQEALNNVSKHAQTDCATVSLVMTNHSASLLIEDQGCGFNPDGLELDRENLGLTSMRERAEKLGGSFVLESQPGGGTRIKVEVSQLNGEESDG